MRFGKQQTAATKYTIPFESLPLKTREAIARREADVIKLVNVWTRLRLIQKLPPRVQILHDLINERFEVSGGTDALAFGRINDLTQEFEKEIRQIKGEV